MFDYNKYYPTESDFPTAEIEKIIAKHDLLASDDLLFFARACWAECNIRHEVLDDPELKTYRVRLESLNIAEVFVEASSLEEAQKLAKENTEESEFELADLKIVSAEEYSFNP
jgi:hypothetical protein